MPKEFCFWLCMSIKIGLPQYDILWMIRCWHSVHLIDFNISVSPSREFYWCFRICRVGYINKWYWTQNFVPISCHFRKYSSLPEDTNFPSMNAYPNRRAHVTSSIMLSQGSKSPDINRSYCFQKFIEHKVVYLMYNVGFAGFEIRLTLRKSSWVKFTFVGSKLRLCKDQLVIGILLHYFPRIYHWNNWKRVLYGILRVYG